MSRVTIAAAVGALVFLVIGAVPAPLSAQCNPCHTCPVNPDARYIGGAGASTIFIESAPNGTCMPECEFFGEECDAFASLEELAEPLLRGESPSVVRLAEEQPERLRYIPGRNLVVVLGVTECEGEGEWLFAFPVREDEVSFVRESVTALE